jgi:hypothetical protein
MSAAGIGGVTRWVLFEQHHVADQAGSHVRTLQQIVAEDAVLRKTSAHGLLKGIDIVDPLADV